MAIKVIYRLIGRLLAQGMSNQEIIEVLTNPLEDYLMTMFVDTFGIDEQFQSLDKETAISLLTNFYKHWQEVNDQLTLSSEDLLNWHCIIRYKLLQLAIRKNAPSAALQIVESLAVLQNVANTHIGESIPIQVNLIPKPLELGNNDNNTTEKKGTNDGTSDG